MKFGIFLLCGSMALLAESAGGLKWITPPGWTSEGSSPMRAVTYRLAATAGGEAPECVVYFFGQGRGGSVEANIERWKSQFTEGGKPAIAKVGKSRIHDIPVTTIDISGTYTATGGMATTPQKPQSDYRMLAAIAEGPGGNIFIRLIGPAKSVAGNLAKYDQLLSSVQKE